MSKTDRETGSQENCGRKDGCSKKHHDQQISSGGKIMAEPNFFGMYCKRSPQTNYNNKIIIIIIISTNFKNVD